MARATKPVTFDAPLWRWEAQTSGWFFVTAPEAAGDKIEDQAPLPRNGFGSIKVEATIGSSTWSTSVFPGNDGWALPVKAQVRKKEGLDEGDVARVTIKVVNS